MVAEDLAKRAGVKDQTTFIVGDFFSHDFGSVKFDAVFTALVVLHIPLSRRSELFAKVRSLLKPGGRMYIEDFARRAEFNAEDRRRLSADVYVPDGDLPTALDYEATLKGAGFDDVIIQDQTDVWSAFVQDRHKSWVERKEELVGVHGETTYEQKGHFYESVKEVRSSDERRVLAPCLIKLRSPSAFCSFFWRATLAVLWSRRCEFRTLYLFN